MDHTLFIALIAGLGGMVGWGLADFFAKKTIDKTDDLTTLFWSQLIGTIPLVIIFVATRHLPDFNLLHYGYLVPFGIVSGLSYLLLYHGFGKGQISLLSPIFASYAAMVVVISAVFFNESIPAHQAIAIGVVLVGLLLANGDPREIRTLLNTPGRKLGGVKEVAGAMLIYSMWLVLLDRIIIGQDWVLIILVIRIVSAITLFIYAKLKRREIAVRDSNLWIYLIAIGIFDVMAYSFVAYGFSQASHLSVVTVLSAAFSVPTIILANLFLKEKLTLLQMSATFIIITGIILVTIS
jgi:drug/metabolite transporter (DMT)-like permease